MVYRGKPSRACSECRIKRRKCDLSRPACRQCVRAGSKCDGYRNENLLNFQDQTAETLGRISVFSDNRGIFMTPGRSQQTRVRQSKERPSHDPWFRVTVAPEDQALDFFFHHYGVFESGRAPTHPDCHSIINTRATGPGYLSNLINAVGLTSLAYLRNEPSLANAANQAFSRALNDIRVGLADSAEAASDQMIVAVMLLALYEVSTPAIGQSTHDVNLNQTVTPSSNDSSSSWDKHVDGALALIQLRGAGQLCNRIGRSIFLNLRTEIVRGSQKSPVDGLSDFLIAHLLPSAQAARTNHIDRLYGRGSK
ncbi:hypothetical protein FOMG_19247 [Fusarium oxysporum f. sp. melonis 26406]|uniref:Zn(2)-C6 fungal-type domain-containing protein n=1 Tax=Fusarium oxysporum f. sp. melonis 26406 TaxID=1089452 RepID=W9Z5Y8_FUSOX|nr:hypothetical protein FOMG_19247 [Fusarium oxysporum f. sp. melonis 26406]